MNSAGLCRSKPTYSARLLETKLIHLPGAFINLVPARLSVRLTRRREKKKIDSVAMKT